VTSSLSDIPGTDPERRGRRRRRSGRRRRPTARGGRLDFAPRALPLGQRRAEGPTVFREQHKRIEPGTIFAAIVGLGTLALVAVLLYQATRADVEQTGLEDGAVLNAMDAAALEVEWTFASADDAAGATLRFDGEEVEEPTVEGDRMIWRPPPELDEGEHVLSLSVPRPVLDDYEFTWRYTIDATPPELELPTVAERVALDEAVDVSGRVEPGANLVAAGREVDVARDGSFTLRFSRPPAGPVALRATDEAGNSTSATVVTPVSYPGMRAVHVSAPAWSSEVLRSGILRLIDEGRIDTVQLDLKDESGIVGFDTAVPRAREIGAVTPHYDLEDAVEVLKDRGARVVGRVVTFRDPALARAAWAAGDGDQVVQSPGGGPYEAPGQFTNFTHPSVRRYNLDIALDAVARGVDDILWDDARRPGGPEDTMVVPGMSGSPEDDIVGFLAQAHTELRRRGAYQGVTAVGIAADRGDTVGQDVRRMARHADYLVPVVLPGYWTAGEYDVASPITQPGELVTGVLGHFEKVTEGTGVVLAPRLQDFGLRGVGYGEAEVRAQISAAEALGVERFSLWDAAVTYTGGALDRQR
jgi:hypothetical protein